MKRSCLRNMQIFVPLRFEKVDDKSVALGACRLMGKDNRQKSPIPRYLYRLADRSMVGLLTEADGPEEGSKGGGTGGDGIKKDPKVLEKGVFETRMPTRLRANERDLHPKPL